MDLWWTERYKATNSTEEESNLQSVPEKVSANPPYLGDPSYG